MDLKEFRKHPGKVIAQLGYHGALDLALVLTVKKLVPNIPQHFVAQYEIANLVPNSPLHGIKESVFHLYDAIDDRTGGHVGTVGEWLDEQLIEIETAVTDYFQPSSDR